MKNTLVISQKTEVPVAIQAQEVQWLVIGGGREAGRQVRQLLECHPRLNVTVIAEEVGDETRQLQKKHGSVKICERKYENTDLRSGMLIIATGNAVLDEKILAEARQYHSLVFLPSNKSQSDFVLLKPAAEPYRPVGNWYQNNAEKTWKNLASKLILAFVLMVMGHVVISYLPLPSIGEIWASVKPHFDYHFLFFVLAGFLAQLVDGMLSMGYGVTSATCLMSFGVSPVSVSAAIHTSEIVTSGISGYSHYKFGNVNKKLFRHLVIPGVIGAILGALLLVFLGDHYSSYLMPMIALYAGFLGLKILIKAFQKETKNKKVKRIGWLAGAGGFFDSFGGGGWGPIVTSSLISKGRSPRYTIGSVSLTEFFVTLSSAFTFFITVGVSHWNVVLGLIVGGAAAAPIAARLAGKLPKKTMMILVGVMVIIWCTRMFIKSIY